MAALTPSKTDQGHTDDCEYHAIVKLLVQNIFRPVLGLEITTKPLLREAMKVPVFKPHEGIELAQLERLPEKLANKYFLFQYLYDKMKRLGIDRTNIAYRLDELLQLETSDSEYLSDIKQSFGTDKKGFYAVVTIVNEDDASLRQSILNKMEDLNYYVGLDLQSTDDSDHMVIIVKNNPTLIKNSWGDHPHEVDLDEDIVLGDSTFQAVRLVFIIPFKEGVDPPPVKFDMDLKDFNEWYDVYERTAGGKKRKTKYGQRRNHHQFKTFRTSRKRTKTHHTRRLFKH